MNKNIKKIDFFIYCSSILSLILIFLLLTSSKSISYNVDNNNEYNANLIREKLNLQEKIEEESVSQYKNIEEKNIPKSTTTESNIHLDKDIINQNVAIKTEDKLETLDKTLEKKIEIHKTEIKQINHIIKKGENLWRIANKYNVPIYSIVKENNIKDPNLIIVGKTLIISQISNGDDKEGESPQIKIDPEKITYTKKKNLKFIWPLKGLISSEFGVRKSPYGNKMEFHTAIDIHAKIGKNFTAAEDGFVIFQGNKGGYGLTIIIEHNNTYKTMYGHCLITFVRVGQVVKKGQIIGRVGQSGIATGPHLHFEIIKNNVSIDPTTLINKRHLYY